jgi:hypothetical protein
MMEFLFARCVFLGSSRDAQALDARITLFSILAGQHNTPDRVRLQRVPLRS